MKFITLTFSTTDRFSSGFLRWAQRCQFSHIEVRFGQYSIGARSTGVNQYFEYPGFKNVVDRYLIVTDEQYAKFDEFMHSKIGDDYDWRAYLGFMFFKKNHSEGKYFCSEIVQEALTYAGIEVLINVNAYFTQPRDFWLSPSLKDKIPEELDLCPPE